MKTKIRSAKAEQRAAMIFKSLGHPSRVRLARRIRAEACCVSDAERCLGLSQPNVSRHLRILREAGLVSGARRGTRICYRLADERVGRLLDILFKKEISK